MRHITISKCVFFVLGGVSVLKRWGARSGELLLDQQQFDDAVEKFDKAFELEQGK